MVTLYVIKSAAISVDLFSTANVAALSIHDFAIYDQEPDQKYLRSCTQLTFEG